MVSSSFPTQFRIFPSTAAEWSTLAFDIQDWLVTHAEEKEKMEWHWAVNLFWLAYCGSDPEFPSCAMDPRFPWQSDVVPLIGEYIMKKMGRCAVGLPHKHEVNGTRYTLMALWWERRDVWAIRGLSAQELRDFVMYK